MWFIFNFFWIVLNGKVNAEVLALGVIMSTAVYLFLYKFMNLTPKREMAIAKSFWDVVKYFIFLTIEIIKANLATAKIILNFEEEPEPVLVKFASHLQTDTGNTFLANSITLTPGTITIDTDQDKFVVHALDTEFAKGIDQCDFVKKLAVMEQKALENTEKLS